MYAAIVGRCKSSIHTIMEESVTDLEAENAAFEDVFKDLITGNMKQKNTTDDNLKPKSILNKKPKFYQNLRKQ